MIRILSQASRQNLGFLIEVTNCILSPMIEHSAPPKYNVPIDDTRGVWVAKDVDDDKQDEGDQLNTNGIQKSAKL